MYIAPKAKLMEMKIITLIMIFLQSLRVLNSFQSIRKSFRTSNPLYLNRIFVFEEEFKQQQSTNEEMITLELNSTDYRYNHIKNVLKLDVGEPFRGGVINKGITNNATILTNPQHNNETMSLSFGHLSDLTPTTRPNITLILAAPRPLRMERIVSAVSCLGIRHLAVIGATKVIKDYLGN